MTSTCLLKEPVRAEISTRAAGTTASSQVHHTSK